MKHFKDLQLSKYPYWLFIIIVISFLGSYILKGIGVSENIYKVLHGISVLGVCAYAISEYHKAKLIVEDYELHPKSNNITLLNIIHSLMFIVGFLVLCILFYEFNIFGV